MEPSSSTAVGSAGAEGNTEEASAEAASHVGGPDEAEGTPSSEEPTPDDRAEESGLEQTLPAHGGAACGPQDGAHCLIVEPRAEGAVDELVNRLREDGLQVEADAERVTLVMTDDAVHRVFGGRVQYRSLARSSGDGFRCQATIANLRIPSRYRAHIQSLSVGHQICE